MKLTFFNSLNMKKILHLMQGLTIASCMIGASMLGAPEALAAGSISTTDVSAVQPCTLVSSTPEDGATVEKLEVFQTVWEGEETEWGMDALNIRDGIYLSNEAGEIVTYGRMRSVPTGFQISLDEVVTTPGEYTLTITAGMMFAGADFDEETFKLVPLAGSENAETVLHFTIAPAVKPCVLVSSTPEDGATVEKLEVFQTVWEGEETEWGMDALNIRDGIYLSNEAGEIVTYGRMRSVPTGFQISLDEVVTTPGEYTLTITAGMMFAGADFDEETFKLVPLAGSENAETVLHFTIAPAVKPCVLVSSTPEDGATVEKLEVFQTVWEGDETADDIEALNSVDGIYLKNEAGDIVTYGRMRGVPSGIQITLDEVVTTPGEYTLTITAGMVRASNFDEETFDMVPLAGSENAETVLSFKVSENVGVGTIAADSQAIRYIGGELTVAGMEEPAISVYTLTGELVAAGTAGAYDLLPGVYVVKAAEQGKEAVAKIIVK